MYKLYDGTNVSEEAQISISLEGNFESEFTKTAAKRDLPKEVDEAIKNLIRKKNHSYVLVTGMGDGETWGENYNSDYFPYDGLMGKQNEAVWGELPGKDERLDPKKETIKRYLTFGDSSFYHHHKNKPERGDPSFGYVPASIWNQKMHTVLMIIGVDRLKDPETANMIDNNETVKVSMGAKLPWDRCSICHKKHKTLLEYCLHLKYQMHQIMSNGKKVYAENLHPRFFDISKVLRPAFLAGLQLEKVASIHNGDMLSVDLAEYYDIGQFDKQAEVDKEAVIYKDIPAHIEGAIARVSNTEKDLPHSLMNDLAALKPKEAWGALTKAGIVAKPNEFAYILLTHDGHTELASKFIHAKATVSHEKPKGLTEEFHDLASVHMNHTAVKFANAIPDSVTDERSLGSLNERIYKTDKGLRKEAEVVRTIGLGNILSALYLLYRKNAETTFNAYGLLGAGISQVLRDDQDFPKYVGNNTTFVDQMNKQAGIQGNIVRGAVGFTAPYILSAHYQNRINNGERVGPIGRLVANNPAKIGLVGAAGAIAGAGPSYKALKQVGGDALGAVKNIFKK